jgi:hypothetical protein
MEKVMCEEHVLDLRVMKPVAGMESRRCGLGRPPGCSLLPASVTFD